MSLNNIPSKMEVMGWTPQSLAHYMRKLKLSGCEKVVMKGSITGAQFMQMTECDLQVFPSLYISIITKIQSDINKGEQKRAFGHKSKAQKYPKQVFVEKEEVWNSDEFDNDSDYDDPDQEEGDDGYIAALTETQTDEKQDSDETNEDDYDLHYHTDTMKPPRVLRGAELQDSHHRDPVPSPAERNSKPPLPHLPRMNQAPSTPFKAPASQANLHIDRSKKPGQSGTSQEDSTKSKGSAVKAPGSSSSKIRHSRTPKSADLSNRASTFIPTPPVPTHPAMVKDSTPGPRGGLDPSWYGGNVSRNRAEAALREVNKDGAFMVRDSSKGLVGHPYTLMLLKQDKVYNIKICNKGNSYILGTGLNNTKYFPGVKEMITHHTQTPLLLIDATDQNSGAQNQCCLLHPAGL